jgi:hypothetical protein
VGTKELIKVKAYKTAKKTKITRKTTDEISPSVKLSLNQL